MSLRIDVAPGETVALVGPNGAGKSTALQVLVGLLSGGAVTLDERRIDRLPPHRRGVGLLAQEPLLFPHLTVLANVAFGPRSHGVGRPESRRVALEWLQRMDVSDLAGRRPRTLSGGQAQRVAIARALATDPDLLLLDEPMAALDVEVRPLVRRLLARVLAERTAIVVTHDVVDALTLADRVVVVESGRVGESGTTDAVLTRPRSVFGARLAGLNRLMGPFDGRVLVTAEGMTIEGTPVERIDAGAGAIALFPPSAVSIRSDGWPVRVADVEPQGDRVRVQVRSDALELSLELAVADVVARQLVVGDPVAVGIDPARVVLLQG